MLTDFQKKEKWQRECSMSRFTNQLNDAVGELVEDWAGDKDDIIDALFDKFPDGIDGWVKEAGIQAWIPE